MEKADKYIFNREAVSKGDCISLSGYIVKVKDRVQSSFIVSDKLGNDIIVPVDSEFIIPVELTSDMLVNMGFVDVGGSKYSMDDVVVKYNRYAKDFKILKNKFKFVHELQHIFKELTQKELNV